MECMTVGKNGRAEPPPLLQGRTLQMTPELAKAGPR